MLCDVVVIDVVDDVSVGVEFIVFYGGVGCDDDDLFVGLDDVVGGYF